MVQYFPSSFEFLACSTLSAGPWPVQSVAQRLETTAVNHWLSTLLFYLKYAFFFSCLKLPEIDRSKSLNAVMLAHNHWGIDLLKNICIFILWNMCHIHDEKHDPAQRKPWACLWIQGRTVGCKVIICWLVWTGRAGIHLHIENRPSTHSWNNRNPKFTPEDTRSIVQWSQAGGGLL